MSHDITLDAHIARSENNLSSNLGGEEVVLNLMDGVYYGLNDVGAHIWSLLDEVPHARALCDRLAQAYDVDRETLEADVLTLLADLEAEGLVEVRPSSDAE
jgi:hypothetical protein